MKFRRRVIALFMSVVMLTFGSVRCVFSSEDEPVGGVWENFESGGGLGGFAGSLGGGVKIAEGTNGNHYMSVCPIVDGVNAFAQHTLDMGDNVNISAQFKYMQSGKKTNGACVFSLRNNGKDVVRFDTSDGNIVMQKANSANTITLVPNYSANTWYDFYVKVNFIYGTVTVTVNGTVRAEEEPLLISVKSADMLYMGTKYSPGFCVDDVKVQPLQTPVSLDLEGETSPKVGSGIKTDYTYTAKAYDAYGVLIKNAVTFSLEPSNEGAVLVQDGDTATLTFTDEADGKTFVITANTGEMSRTVTLNPEIYIPEVTSIKISGDAKLSSRTQKLYRYKYTAECYDQYGVKMEGEQCSFRLAPGEIQVPSTLSVNADTGEITVTGELPKDRHIYLVAESKSNHAKTAQKKLTLLDAETYASDASRFETLLDYVDLVRQIGRDPYNGTPLIATVYDRYAKQLGEWRSGTDSGHAVVSNLAFQGGWFRTLEGLYTLTGDRQYQDEVLNTYQYYLDHYLDDETGIPVMGGHAAVNLQNGTKYYVYNSKYLELKDSGFYIKPFFDIDPDKASEIVKNMFCSTVSKWKYMRFNRHGKYGVKPNYANEGYGWDDWQTWSTKLIDDDFGEGNPVVVQEIGFRSSASDFFDCFGAMARYGATDEQRGAGGTWGYNLLSTFYRLENPETFIGAYQNNSFGIDRYDEQMAKYPDWYLPNVYKSSNPSIVVDRFYLQFWEDLVDQGFLKESDKWYAQECYISTTSQYTAMPMHELSFAEDLGLDTEKGGYVLERTVKKLGKYVDIAYDASDNTWASRVLWDGTVLDGFVSKRAGYYGGVDEYMRRYTRTNVGTLEPLSFAMAYLKSKDRDDLQSYRDSIYYFLRNTLIAKEIGDIGENYPGDNVNLNTDCDNSDGYMCLTMLYLYQATGVTDFLDMARHIADNFISAKMVDGLFTITTSDVYIPLGSCKADRFEYSLLLLEAAVRGEMDEMPVYIPYDGYFEDRSYDELEKGYKLSSQSDIKDTTYWFGYSFDGVHATEISVSENEITLSLGERKYLEISVLPVDASYSLCYDNTNPSCVAIDYSSNSLKGLSRGTAEITISNADKTAKTVLTVTVE